MEKGWDQHLGNNLSEGLAHANAMSTKEWHVARLSSPLSRWGQEVLALWVKSFRNERFGIVPFFRVFAEVTNANVVLITLSQMDATNCNWGNGFTSRGNPYGGHPTHSFTEAHLDVVKV